MVVATAAAVVPAVAATTSSTPNAVSPGARQQLEDASKRAQAAQPPRGGQTPTDDRRFAGQSDRKALETAASQDPGLFAPQQTRLLAPRAGEKIEAYLGDNAARIDVPGSSSDVIANSTLPLRVGEGADKQPVDLALVDRGDRLEPRAPIVAVGFPKTLGAGFDVGSGVTMRLAGAETQTASQRAGQQVFYANVLRDTDVFATPLPTGTETFVQLRSPDSPRRLAWEFDLPAGAQLVQVPAASGMPDHAEIQRDDKVLIRILPAVAKDADDTNVPVAMSVDANQLVLDVSAADDVAYPVLVDPIMENNFAGNPPNANTTSGTTSDVLGWIAESNVALSQFAFSPGSNGITGGQCLRSNLSQPGGAEVLNNVL